MIIAIQQPEHIPWIGFFNKMIQCDLFVYLDNVQFKKRYFENRNKIKTQNGVAWLTVPVVSKGRFTQKINEVEIDNESDWRKKYRGNLEHAFKKTEFWEYVNKITTPCFEENNKLLDLNISLIDNCRKFLKIQTKSYLASDLVKKEHKGSNLLLEICLHAGADTYISGPDGRNYLDELEFRRNGIKIVYHDFQHPLYKQRFGSFVSHLTLLDLIANCGDESRQIINNSYRINFKNEN